MRLVLVGAPGSGKGTQAERLVARQGLVCIGTGDILRDAIKRQTDVGKLAKPLIDVGRLVPDEVVNDLVAELFRANRPDRFVMDGYPRTYSQAVAFDALLKQQYLSLDAVVNLTISDDEVVRRIGSRRCCDNKACRTCFNLAFRPPKADGVCDKCGSKLVLRDDDKPETIRRRLVEFHENTEGLLAHYRRAGLLRDVPATDGMEAIYENILRQLPPA